MEFSSTDPVTGAHREGTTYKLRHSTMRLVRLVCSPKATHTKELEATQVIKSAERQTSTAELQPAFRRRPRLDKLFLYAVALGGWVAACGTPSTSASKTAPPSTRTTGTSVQCGTLTGVTATDLQHIETFCTKGIAPGAVTLASAHESILTLTVSRGIADGIRADHLAGEQLISAWLRGWRQVTGRKAVTILVQWSGVEVATGDTTILGEDRVTIR